MRVSKRPDDAARTDATRRELTAFLRDSGVEPPVCGANCPHHQSRTPEFDCSRSCPDAQYGLSSDPARFPVEAKIVALVFELKRIGVFYPCWSCEGHLDASGVFQRAPAVWFYCDNLLSVRLLSDGIADLHANDKLSRPWHLRVTYTEGDSTDTAFALEPLIEDRSAVNLEALQADAALIAREMQTMMRSQAQDLLWSLNK